MTETKLVIARGKLRDNIQSQYFNSPEAIPTDEIASMALINLKIPSFLQTKLSHNDELSIGDRYKC